MNRLLALQTKREKQLRVQDLMDNLADMLKSDARYVKMEERIV